MKQMISLLVFQMMALSANAGLSSTLITEDKRRVLNREFRQLINPVMNLVRSGDIVGNGGGLAEQNFLFTYRQLGNIIASCIETDYCNFKGRDLKVLFRIQEIADKNKLKENQLVFLNNLMAPTFFFDSYDAQTRTAKTGYSDEFPIFINLDIVYSEGSDLISNTAAITGLLIHEIGHQAGVQSHRELDILATKLRKYVSLDSTYTKIAIFNRALSIKSYSARSHSAKNLLLLEYENKIFDLSVAMKKSLKCSNKNDQLVNVKTSNIHWKRPVQSSVRADVKAKMWADITCIDEFNVSWPEQRDVILNLTVLRGNRYCPEGQKACVSSIEISSK